MSTVAAPTHDAAGVSVLDLVITDEQRAMFACAARLAGQSLEAFAIDAIGRSAERLIRGDIEPVKPLSAQAYLRLVERLDHPAEPSDEVRDRFRRSRQRLAGDG